MIATVSRLMENDHDQFNTIRRYKKTRGSTGSR
jgi:hypothetical protein